MLFEVLKNTASEVDERAYKKRGKTTARLLPAKN